jgi:CheY-like chemotaxis protein
MSSSPIKSVLVVDDSRLARMLISKFILSRYPHWLILEASNGHEAIEKAKHESPNYITMDYNMEGMTGGEAAQQILASVPQTSIVLFTANIQASTRAQAEGLGICFVAKPVTEQTVQQALDYFVGRP